MSIAQYFSFGRTKTYNQTKQSLQLDRKFFLGQPSGQSGAEDLKIMLQLAHLLSVGVGMVFIPDRCGFSRWSVVVLQTGMAGRLVETVAANNHQYRRKGAGKLHKSLD